MKCTIVEKKDLMYLVAALVLVLVIALVIKPIATGHTLKTGLPTTTPAPITILETGIRTQISIVTTLTLHTLPTTVAPTWDPKSPKNVSFVDNSSKYGVSHSDDILHGTRFNESNLDDGNRTTIAIISKSISGNGTQMSGATEIMYIPFPYWEMVYTVDPSPQLKPETIQVTPTLGEGGYSGISGSYSTVKPQFTIQVMDGDDPNRIVRTVTPPGGINLDLWVGVTPTTQEVGTPDAVGYGSSGYTNFKSRQLKTLVPTPTPVDPRPWNEKFFEGQRNYYFIITAQSIDSYKIEIKVPSRYIGKY